MKEINLEDFQKENLVIESDRVLVYSKMFCPLDCKYCFVEDLNNERNGQNIYLSPEQALLLERLPENVKTIMLGCDTEFFLDEKEAIRVLKIVSVLGKDISMITKLSLSDNLINFIKEISEKMKVNNNILSFSVSIPCFESSELWEPKAPKIEERLNTLIKVSKAGVPSMVAIRPLIPSIDRDEIKKIIEATRSYVFGYYSGPLYIKDLNGEMLTIEDKENPDISITEVQPDWMPKGNTFFKVENPKIMLYLKELVEENGKLLFSGAAQGTDFIKEKTL